MKMDSPVELKDRGSLGGRDDSRLQPESCQERNSLVSSSCWGPAHHRRRRDDHATTWGKEGREGHGMDLARKQEMR